MSCRHDLALGTCAECYPETGTIFPHPEDEQLNLDGPGARPAVNEEIRQVLSYLAKLEDGWPSSAGARALGWAYAFIAAGKHRCDPTPIDASVASIRDKALEEVAVMLDERSQGPRGCGGGLIKELARAVRAMKGQS